MRTRTRTNACMHTRTTQLYMHAQLHTYTHAQTHAYTRSRAYTRTNALIHACHSRMIEMHWYLMKCGKLHGLEWVLLMHIAQSVICVSTQRSLIFWRLESLRLLVRYQFHREELVQWFCSRTMVLFSPFLGETFFCFSQIRQPHTRDQRPKKKLSSSVLGPDTRGWEIKKNILSTRGTRHGNGFWSYSRE